MRFFSFSLAAALALACGGQTTTVNGGDDASTDHQSSPDEGIDVSLSASCPISPPTVGQACSGLANGFQCEYGASFWAVCDSVFVCNGGTWTADNTHGACPGEENVDCPSSLSQITQGGDCLGQSKSNETCDYGGGSCVCEGFCGGVALPDAATGPTWKCSAPDPTCPPERPRFGSSCTGSASCSYDICCAGSDMQCQNGTWQGTTMMAGCP